MRSKNTAAVLHPHFSRSLATRDWVSRSSSNQPEPSANFKKDARSNVSNTRFGRTPTPPRRQDTFSLSSTIAADLPNDVLRTMHKKQHTENHNPCEANASSEIGKAADNCGEEKRDSRFRLDTESVNTGPENGLSFSMRPQMSNISDATNNNGLGRYDQYDRSNMQYRDDAETNAETSSPPNTSISEEDVSLEINGSTRTIRPPGTTIRPLHEDSYSNAWIDDGRGKGEGGGDYARNLRWRWRYDPHQRPQHQQEAPQSHQGYQREDQREYQLHQQHDNIPDGCNGPPYLLPLPPPPSPPPPNYCPPIDAVTLRWNRGWTELHDDMLRKWKSQVFVYMQLQRSSYAFFRNIYNAVTYPTLALTIVSSVVVNLSESFGMRISVSIMNIIATILTAVLRQMEPAERAQAHRDTSAQYNTLLHSMESCMNVPFYMRPESKVFIEKVRNDMIRLIMTQVEPPDLVLRSFERRVGQIDGIMYGQDVVEIMVSNLCTRAMVRQLQDEQAATRIKNKVTQDVNAILSRNFKKTPS